MLRLISAYTRGEGQRRTGRAKKRRRAFFASSKSKKHAEGELKLVDNTERATEMHRVAHGHRVPGSD